MTVANEERIGQGTRKILSLSLLSKLPIKGRDCESNHQGKMNKKADKIFQANLYIKN